MTPGRFLLFLFACLAIGVLFGALSAATGVAPIPLALGSVGLIIATASAFAPAYIPNYDRHKDHRQQ